MSRQENDSKLCGQGMGTMLGRDEMGDDANTPRVIVLGNEKGGTGKSTTAVHLLFALARQGWRTAAIDLDDRQRSLTRYLENRRRYAAEKGLPLLQPPVEVVPASLAPTRETARLEEREAFRAALAKLKAQADIVIIDCPGRDCFLSRLAHAHADILITPMNDSFVDLDLLATVHPDDYRIERLSLYAEMVFEAKKQRALTFRKEMDWIVMRNRLANLDARNKRRVERVLTTLAKRLGFRFVPGLSERVIYRELFPKGLTLVDLVPEDGQGAPQKLTLSHIAAREELRRLVDALRLKRDDRPKQEALVAS